METTFITIHDLSPEARILYSSDSIVDILGHTPDEVVGRSCWEFFHPEELPIARDLHSRGVKLDKAAVLAYCQIKNRDNRWVGCECCFTVVYDVMVCCTSIYRHGMTSQKRATEAPIVRRLFSSSPQDPRYHMLSHLSSKFNQSEKRMTHEPRAALFLNRFTRTLTIMYATSGIEQILGIPGEDMKGKSFYYCIAENCLEDAVRCLETAKGNDSIAYLRFWFRDPRQDDAYNRDTSEEDTDEGMTDITSSDEDEDGGVHLHNHSYSNGNGDSSREYSVQSQSHSSANGMSMTSENSTNMDGHHPSRASSGDSSNPTSTHEAIFGHPAAPCSSSSSLPLSPTSTTSSFNEPIELEAVVSCTSDGLVVCLRRARPLMPPCVQEPQVAAPVAQPYVYANGLFAAPWAAEPMYLPPQPRYQPFPAYGAGINAGIGGRAQPPYYGPRTMPGGPAQDELMTAIRETAVFAWALTGINGSLAEYSRGKPAGESQPPGGMPVWAREDSGNGEFGQGWKDMPNSWAGSGWTPWM